MFFFFFLGFCANFWFLEQYDFDVYKRRCCNKTTFNTDKGVVRRVENLNTIRGHVEEEFNEITPR